MTRNDTLILKCYSKIWEYPIALGILKENLKENMVKLFSSLPNQAVRFPEMGVPPTNAFESGVP